MRPSNLLLIFDLDGTLIDSQQDLVIATNATRGHVGLPPLPAAVVQSYVGHGAANLVRRAMGPGASDELAATALAFFLQYYRAHSLQHTRLYQGVAESIEGLAGQQHSLAVLTNKPRKISEDIVCGLGISRFFFAIYGGDSFAEKKPHPIGIDTLRKEAAASAAETWMIGDSGVDIQTARNAGVRACGVSWGFQPDAFERDAPDALVHGPAEWLNTF